MTMQRTHHTSALSCTHLCASYHLRAPMVLNHITLELPKAQWTCIVGPNGAGKSSLLMALSGLMPHHTGSIQLFGQPLHEWPLRERAQTVAWLSQKQPTADDLRVIDVVMLGRIPHQNWLGAASQIDQDVVASVMEKTQCSAWSERSFGELSGGEQQRVLLARALAVQAKVLLMDEPLANLDPPHQSDWISIIQDLVSQGVTVVSVMHELPIALQADHMVIMGQSHVVHQGPTKEATTHRALEATFNHRITIAHVHDQWTSLPRIQKN